MLGSVSITSMMRCAETAARGTITNMNVAMSTENRIMNTYCRKAVRSPMGMLPSAICLPPNHMMAMVVKFMISVTAGNTSANSRPTLSEVSVRSWLATLKRRSS